MNKVANKKLLYLGLILGFSRIVIGIIVSKLSLDIGYFFDIFIFAYLYLWLLIMKQKFSLKYIILVNVFIAIIAIVVYDLYLLFFKYYPISLKPFVINRSTVALNILIISNFSVPLCAEPSKPVPKICTLSYVNLFN